MHTTATVARRLSAVVLAVALTLGVALPVSAAGFGTASQDGTSWFGASFVQWVQSLVIDFVGWSAPQDESVSNFQGKSRAAATPDGHDVTAKGGALPGMPAPDVAIGN